MILSLFLNPDLDHCLSRLAIYGRRQCRFDNGLGDAFSAARRWFHEGEQSLLGHGCSAVLAALIAASEPDADDTRQLLVSIVVAHV